MSSQETFDFADQYQRTPRKEALHKPPSRFLATHYKAELIATYLRYFVFVTKHGAYIDAFAGPQEEQQDAQNWAIRRVLERQPSAFHISKYYLFEKSRTQFARLEDLRDSRPLEQRELMDLQCGDCNILIPQLLQSQCINPKHAMFALLDQRGVECSWSTVRNLAAYASSAKFKSELFYFLPVAWLHRSVHALKPENGRRWWGRDDYQEVLNLRGYDLAIAFVERFKAELGYQYCVPFPFHERERGQGRLLYFMVHASDHHLASGLMWRSYNEVGNPPAEEARQDGLPSIELDADPCDLPPGDRGALAWVRGWSSKECPYPARGPAAREWRDGWEQARRDYLKRWTRK